MNSDIQDLNPRQSLDLITSMIMEAKGKVQRNNFYFLFWGWVIVAANLGMYALTMLDYARPYIVWSITIPAWIYTLIVSFRKSRQEATSTHFDRISAWLWISFGITLFILAGFGFRINFQINPVILTVTAIPTLVSGVVLRFRPLIFGGIAFWIGGIAAFLTPFESQPLVGALTILAGYLIPGYMLKAKTD